MVRWSFCRRSLVLVGAALVLVPGTGSAQLAATAAEARWVAPPVTLATPLQEQGRNARKGALIGAAVGGVAGLGAGVFLTLFCEAEGDDCPGAIPILTVLGTAGGAVVGAVLGAAFPSVRADVPVTEAAPRPRGSIAFAAGYAHADMENDAGPYHEGNGPAYRLVLLAELAPWLALGPEVGLASFGTGGGDVRHGAAAVQLRYPVGRVHPYVGGHIGAYQTTGPSLEFLGGGAAVGARVFPLADARLFVELEARADRHLQNIAPFHFRGVTLGVGTAW